MHIIFLDYISKKKAIVNLDEYPRNHETDRQLIKERAEWTTRKNFQSTVFYKNKIFSNDFVVRQNIKTRLFILFAFPKGMGNLRFSQIHPFSISKYATIFLDKCPY